MARLAGDSRCLYPEYTLQRSKESRGFLLFSYVLRGQENRNPQAMILDDRFISSLPLAWLSGDKVVVGTANGQKAAGAWQTRRGLSAVADAFD